MIKSITVTNHLGESLKLEMRFPEKSGFLIQSIDGLGPSKANINTTDMSTGDGSVFTSSRVQARNIVLDLAFMWEPSIETVRQNSYKYFPIKKRITLLIETDNRICETHGYVESNEPNIFSRSSGTQISIICPDPYFYSPRKNVTVFSGVESMFEFPVSNESLEEELIEFGNIKLDTTRNLFYDGDADVGVTILIHAYGDATNITIYNSGTHESMVINTAWITALTGTGFGEGDDLIISTIRGDKSIKLLRDGVYINVLNCLDRDSDWFTLAKGDNVFAYTAETGILKLMFTIENQTVYEGV